MKKLTEESSLYNDLENKSVFELITDINTEDRKVALVIKDVLPSIENLVNPIIERMKLGGRLFYIGAGTSGRLGVVDASEIPPTFGVDHGVVIGIIAGGDMAIRKAVEFAEDNLDQAWIDLKAYHINKMDSVIGIAASGSTPYVIGGLKRANEHDILTGAIVCNANSLVAREAKFPVEVLVGPEFVTGSTRLKSGTAQKMVLNMISTSIMIKLGKVKGNKMVDMQLSNNKLIDRAVKMIMDELKVAEDVAKELLIEFGNVRNVLEGYKNK